VTIPSDPGETSIPWDEADVHQLLSSGSAPSLRPPSVQLSSTMITPHLAAGAIARNATNSAQQPAQRIRP
jgi:hypothetical protein